jgi:hypothetical protein
MDLALFLLIAIVVTIFAAPLSYVGVAIERANLQRDR